MSEQNPLLGREEVNNVLKRTLAVLFAAILLIAVCLVPSMAQTSTTPDASVKGSGTITANTTNTGQFDINVARFGTTLSGGFKYSEISADGSQVLARIYSQTITDMVVMGNTATIKASGFWDGMPANLTIKVLDDTAGDSFQITAEQQLPPGSMAPIRLPYNQGGGLTSGDIRVVGQTPVLDMSTKGDGTILVKRNTGRFSFHAEKISGVVKGALDYTEYNPMIMSPTLRAAVRIYIPAVEKLAVTGNTAVFSGKGTFNGMPASIEVTAVDYTKSAIAVPDHFTIKATTLTGKLMIATFYYSADGPLTSGDVVVYSKQ